MRTAAKACTLAALALVSATALADFPSRPSFVLDGLSCPYQLALADLNNDGKADLAVASWRRKGKGYDQQQSRVLLFFQKAGTLAPPADVELRVPNPWGMCAGDFDGDGKTDLAVKETRRVLHLFPGADGFAADHKCPNVNDSDRYVTAARLSPGGLMDFVAGPVWRKWRGGDKFSAGYCYGPKQNDNRFAAVADLNGDGHNDIAFLASGLVRLYYGPFTTQTVRPSELSQFVEIKPPAPATALCVADMNADGRADVVARLSDRKAGRPSTVVYHQNAPMGFIADQQPSLVLGDVWGELDAADLNRDGLTDLVVADSSKGRVHVFMQRRGQLLGTGPADAYQALRVRNHTVAIGDLNGDGRPDLAVSDGKAAVRFFLNDGRDDPERVAAVARAAAPPGASQQPAATKPEPAPQPAAVGGTATEAVKLALPKAQPGPDYEDPYRMPFYTGAILPTPQQVTYKDIYFPLRKTGLMLGSEVDPAGAQVRELRERIVRYGGGVRIVESIDAECDTLVLLGNCDASRRFGQGQQVPDREQAYVMRSVAVGGKGILVLRASDSLGLLWAVSSLNQLVHERGGRPVVRGADVVDYPQARNRGFIAGHWPDAGPYCIAFKMNKPVFQGALHDYSIPNRRERAEAWRKPLTQAVRRDLKAYGDRLSPAGITWYAGGNPIASEHKFRSGNEDDFQVILSWAGAAAEAGGNLCVKYDDHRFPISPEDMKDFGSAREADVHLLNRLHRELKARHPSAKILFCPPFYWGPTSPAMYPEPRDDYLYALGKRLPKDIDIFWTGPRVKSAHVTPEMVGWIVKRIQRKPVYWQNGFGMPHMFLYHYATDPVEAYQRWFYDGFLGQIDTYMFNCMMPSYAAAAATCSDYGWNPGSYDAARSVREAATKLVGADTYPALVALNQALSYFDPFGLRRTPGAAQKLPEMKGKLAAVNAVWAEIERRNIKAVRKWTNMARHVGQVNRFYQRLRQSPNLAAYRQDAGESQKHAEQEAGFSQKTGIFLSAYDFVGGCGPKKYGNRCEPRLATWVYGARSANPKMAASFRVEPFPPPCDYEVVVSGQDDDADAQCRIRVWVNKTMIFEGESPFVRFGWSRHTFRVPATALARRSVLRMENAEDTSRAGGPPFLMLNYAVVRKATAGK